MEVLLISTGKMAGLGSVVEAIVWLVCECLKRVGTRYRDGLEVF